VTAAETGAAATTAVLSLGSNLGDREQTLRRAVSAVDQVAGVRVVAASGIVETAALTSHGVDGDAPAYLNAILEISTSREPEALLAVLGEIEQANGRVREERWGDRTLDIDIVAYGDVELQTDRLTLPHPRAAERAFVLAPWLHVNPDARIPGRGRVDELLLATGETVPVFAAEPLVAQLFTTDLGVTDLGVTKAIVPDAAGSGGAS
jgi:2-amino-4-hydroxy-6-hydroxymethyldihydropteridine diphosphokinase